MPIDLKQLNQSELSGFITDVLNDTYRVVLGNNIVYTDTTNQTISGFKTFRNPPNVPYAGTTGQVPSLRYVNDKIDQASGNLNSKITTISGFNFFSFQGDFSNSGFYDPYDAVYYQGSTYGYTGTISFNGATGTPLSGDWHKLAASGAIGANGPIGSFINSGTLTGSFFDSSFFIDIPYTGLNVMEGFVSHSGILTGYVLGSHTAGTSGILSGSIYTRDTDNTKTTLLNFSMNTGELFKTGIITGNFNPLYRIGVDLYSGLSGMRGLTIGIFGMEWGG